jgi:hypothetical protein
MTAQTRLAARIALVVGVIGGLAVIVASAGVSSTPLVGRQAGWGALGVAGTFGVVAASFLWVATGRQAVVRRATEVRLAILAGAREARSGATATTSTSTGARPEAGTDLVASAAMVHYHRAGCRLTTGKPVTAARQADHEQAGRTPCGVCEP